MFSGSLCLLILILRARRSNFSFKCHRKDSSASVKDQAMVYAVNDISFHPVHGTFSTCGRWSLSSFNSPLIVRRLGWDHSLLGQGCPQSTKMYDLPS